MLNFPVVTATLDFIKFAWDHPMIYCIFLVSEKNYLSMFYIQSLSCYCGNIEFQIEKKKQIFRGPYTDRVMVFNATFNNIFSYKCILWRSILLVEETRVPRENH